MDSIIEMLTNYSYAGLPHIRTNKFNGFAVFSARKITKCRQSLLLAILADPKQTATMLINLVHATYQDPQICKSILGGCMAVGEENEEFLRCHHA